MIESNEEAAKKAIRKPINLNYEKELSVEVQAEIENMFLYHPWDADKVAHGEAVRKVLIYAMGVIIEHVPPSPDRSAAIRKLREARMDCNSAITHGGKY